MIDCANMSKLIGVQDASLGIVKHYRSTKIEHVNNIKRHIKQRGYSLFIISASQSDRETTLFDTSRLTIIQYQFCLFLDIKYDTYHLYIFQKHPRIRACLDCLVF